MELSQQEIKTRMNNWVTKRISEYRKQEKKLTRSMMAEQLNVTSSCFSQYLNPSNPKSATWEFQIKLSALLNHSIRELHPELFDLSMLYTD